LFCSTAHRWAGPQVVEVGVEHGRPASLVRPAQPAAGLLGERGVVLGVGTAQRRQLAACPQQFAAVGTQRLQHRVADLSGRRPDGDERVVHQRREQVDERVLGADLLGRGQREPAGEHRQSAEQALLGGAQQGVRPVDDCAERPVARDHGGLGGGEQPETVADACREVGGVERACPGRRQFDAQRQPVELAAHVGDVREIVLAEVEIGPDRPCPVDEQLHGGRVGRVGPGFRKRQRHGGPQVLAGHAERGPARRQHGHVRTTPHHGLHQPGGIVEHMFAVVDHEQYLPRRQEGEYRLLDAPARLLLRADRCGQRMADDRPERCPPRSHPPRCRPTPPTCRHSPAG
jgi:hypothetical protein